MFKIGTDPEFFLYDTERNCYISAHNLVPGNKKDPHRLPDGSHIQADGTAVEFNIEPSETGKEFAAKIDSALREIRKIVPKKYRFDFVPYIEYTPAVWKEIPDYAKELGCDPDYFVSNIISLQTTRNQVPDPGMARTGSGHIHCGWTEKSDTREGGNHFLDGVGLVYSLNLVFSKYSSYDTRNCVRQVYYGRPYSFRSKPYGVEYRSLSNKWINNPTICGRIGDVVLKTMRYEFGDNEFSPLELSRQIFYDFRTYDRPDCTVEY